MRNATSFLETQTCERARSLGRWTSLVGLATAIAGGLLIPATALLAMGPGAWSGPWRHGPLSLALGGTVGCLLVGQGMSLHDGARNFRVLAETGDPRMVVRAIARVGRYFVVDAWLCLVPWVALLAMGAWLRGVHS